MDNLVRVAGGDLDRDAERYYDEVKRHAERIMRDAQAIMKLAADFKAEADRPDPPANR
jgi:hypothetical protein